MKISLWPVFWLTVILILIFAWEVDWYWAIGLVVLANADFTYESS